MSAHVLFNSLKELGKRDKMRGLLSILSLFRNKFNKFNDTRARMLDSIYHMAFGITSLVDLELRLLLWAVTLIQSISKSHELVPSFCFLEF